MPQSSPLTEAERAKAAADAEHQVQRTLNRHFPRPGTDPDPSQSGRSEA